jgi:hypothetical protein
LLLYVDLTGATAILTLFREAFLCSFFSSSFTCSLTASGFISCAYRALTSFFSELSFFKGVTLITGLFLALSFDASP